MSDDFLAVVRKACLPAIWSQGAKLAREGSVSRAPDPNEYRVRAPGVAVAPTVTLFVDDGEWSCDCGGKVDPCAHVAAAAIAAAQGLTASAASEAARTPTTKLAYRYAVRERRLMLARAFVGDDGKEEKLVGSLASLVARGKVPGGLAPTHDDLRLDRIFGDTTKPDVPLARMADVLEATSHASLVTLDGAPVRTAGEPVKPQAVVDDDANGGFVVRIEKSPEVTAVVAMGVVRVGDVLRPIAEADLTGEWLEHLPRTRKVANLSELAAQIVPELEKKMEVDVRTRRLPRTAKRMRPRVAFDLSHQGHALSVMPTIVYGDPPIARVDGEALVVLGGDAVPERRRDEEHALVLSIRDRLNLVPGRRVHFDGGEAAAFAAKLRDWQGEHGGDPELLGKKRALVARVIADGERFDVVFESDEPTSDAGGKPSRAETAAVMRAFREGLDFVPLTDGGWGTLPRDWLAKHGARVADLLAAKGERENVPNAALPELGSLLRELDMPPPVALERLMPLVAGGGALPPASLPSDLTATLRDYQRQGVDWLCFLRDAKLGGVLADDMGLGKTVQTIASLSGRVLVVCPKSVVYNWAQEIARFRPSLRANIYHGPGRKLDPKADVTITTYAVLRIDIEALERETWSAVVLDEAQAIKNESSQAARAAFRLRADVRVALSGTPVENRLEELWSVMHFANPGLLGGRSDFRDRIAAPILAGEAGAAERLRAKIRPFVMRRLKRDVLKELPPRTEMVLHVELDDDERAVYDAVRAATKRDIVAKLGQGNDVLAALEALLRLRQAASHRALVPGQRGESSSKIEALLEALEDAAADGHKALVFSQWTSMLDLVEPHLASAGIRFTRLDGSTRDRGAVVEEFQNEAGPPVMLVSLKAGGTGLNLTAADHVFLLDPWWNPAVEDQAADRAHRIGQDRPVMVYRLVAKDTVEERILSLKEKKRALADAALAGAEAAGAITKDDLLALLDD